MKRLRRVLGTGLLGGGLLAVEYETRREPPPVLVPGPAESDVAVVIGGTRAALQQAVSLQATGRWRHIAVAVAPWEGAPPCETPPSLPPPRPDWLDAWRWASAWADPLWWSFWPRYLRRPATIPPPPPTCDVSSHPPSMLLRAAGEHVEGAAAFPSTPPPPLPDSVELCHAEVSEVREDGSVLFRDRSVLHAGAVVICDGAAAGRLTAGRVPAYPFRVPVACVPCHALQNAPLAASYHDPGTGRVFGEAGGYFSFYDYGAATPVGSSEVGKKRQEAPPAEAVKNLRRYASCAAPLARPGCYAASAVDVGVTPDGNPVVGWVSGRTYVNTSASPSAAAFVASLPSAEPDPQLLHDMRHLSPARFLHSFPPFLLPLGAAFLIF